MSFTGTGYLRGGGPRRGPLKNRPGPRTRLHVVVNGVALCGAKPTGASKGWEPTMSAQPTCSDCKARRRGV
jgi:hypothetical protein